MRGLTTIISIIRASPNPPDNINYVFKEYAILILCEGVTIERMYNTKISFRAIKPFERIFMLEGPKYDKWGCHVTMFIDNVLFF